MKLIDILVEELPKRGGWPTFIGSLVQNSSGAIYQAGGGAPVMFTSRSDDWELAEITRAQYEAALAAKNDGWIEWGGGERPVEKGMLVDVKFNNGEMNKNSLASSFSWFHEWESCNIIAYRPHKTAEVKTEWNGEGLPPVGCECEFTNGPYRAERGEFSGIIPTEGQSVEVVAHKVTSDDNEVAVVYWDDSGAGRSACFVPECFRPLRTEADRKRDAAIAKLTNAICGEIPDTGMATSAKYAERVYSSIAAGKIPGVKLED